MGEVKNDITMEDVVKKTYKIRQGQIVEGTIFEVKSNQILVTLDNNQEAEMYIEHYGKSIDSFIGEVKVGDKIEAVVSSIQEDGERASKIFLDRKRMVRQENFVLVEEIYKNEQEYEAKVTKVDKKGLHLDVYGFSAFLPFGLLDNELIEQKEELKGKLLKVHLIEVKPGRRPRIIASRKKIFEERRAQEREEVQKQREEEFASINTGDVIKGTVEKLHKYMAVVRFKHITGRLRISQISHTRIENIKDVLKVGDEVEVKVIKKAKGLDLSMKALIPTPIETFIANNKIGDTVVGEVVQKLPFGIILELDEKVRGLLHRSEFSWNPDDNFQSYVKIGDKVEAKITSLDAAKNKISLSRRLLLDNPWENVSFERGELVEAKVLEVNADGLVVLAKGVNGIIPINELSKERVDDPAKLFAVDDKVKAIVTTVNPKNWYLRLSIKAYELREEKKAYEKHLVEEDVETTSIGELIVEMLEEENDKE